MTETAERETDFKQQISYYLFIVIINILLQTQLAIQSYGGRHRGGKGKLLC